MHPESVELVKKIAREPRDILGQTNRPFQPVVIKHITIQGLTPAKAATVGPKRPSTARPAGKAGMVAPKSAAPKAPPK